MLSIVLLFILSCGSGGGSKDTDLGLDQTPVQSSEKADITITVEGLDSGPGILGGILGDQYFRADDVNFDETGTVHITREKRYDQGLYFIQLPGNNGTFQFLLGPDQEFSMKTTLDNPVKDMEVEGSVDNEGFYKHLAFQTEYQREFNNLTNQMNEFPKDSPERKKIEEERSELIESRMERIASYDEQAPGSLFAKFIQSGQKPKIKYPKKKDGSVDRVRQSTMYRNEYWDGYDFTDSRLLRTPVFHNKLSEFIDKLVPQNADSLIKYADWLTRKSMANDSIFKYTANYIGVKYKEPEFMGGDAVYVHMVQNFFTQDKAFWSTEGEIRQLQFDAAIRAKSLPGRKAQNLKATTATGESFELYELNAPFKVIYMYSISCDNCRKETPKLVKFYNEWKNKGVEVVAISIDDDEAGWKNYMAKNNMNWINIFDPDYTSGYNTKYHMDITPEMYLLDKDNVIIGKDLKTFQVEELVKKNM